MAELVEEQGVKFELTKEIRERLKKAGADVDVLAAVGEASIAYIRRQFENGQQPEEAPPLSQVRPSGQTRVTELLGRARQQMVANRLTMPTGDNALETYREILRLAPNQAEAVAGIQRIKAQYVQWAEAAEQRGEWAKPRDTTSGR